MENNNQYGNFQNLGGQQRINKIENVKIETENNVSMKVASYCELITNVDLAKRITSTLKLIFKDYHGTSINIDGNGNIIPNLWFSPKTNNGEGIIAVKENDLKIQSGNGISTVAALKNYNSIVSGNAKPYILSNDAKSILSQFMGGDPNKINWNRCVEFRDNAPVNSTYMNRNNRETLTKISNISLRKLMEFIHGKKIEVDNDSKNPIHSVCYDLKYISPLRPKNFNPMMMGGIIPNTQEDFLIQILCIDNVIMDELKNTMGIDPGINTIKMY